MIVLRLKNYCPFRQCMAAIDATIRACGKGFKSKIQLLTDKVPCQIFKFGR